MTAVMQPFVRSKEDLIEVRNALDQAGCREIRLLAKIENRDGIRKHQYWMEHGMPLIAVFYMMFIQGKRPKYWHLWLAVGLLVLLSIPSIIANRSIPDVNYMYLGNFAEGSTKTVDPLSFFPQSQGLRYATMMVLTIVLFHLLYAVEQYIERHVRKK